MNLYFLISGVLFLLIGIIHSLLGEHLIFSNFRANRPLSSSEQNTGFKERHLRIIWATWHLATIFGWCFGLILIKISLLEHVTNPILTNFVIQSITSITFGSSLLVLIGTKGKHPGWIGFLLIGILLLFGC